MHPSGNKPTMGVQAMLQQNSTHTHGANMINNNVPINFSNSSSITKSPVIITTITPPSPQVTVKNLPSDPSPTPSVSVVSSNPKTSVEISTTTTPPRTVTVGTTSPNNTNVTGVTPPNSAGTTTTNSAPTVTRPSQVQGSQFAGTASTVSNSTPVKVDSNKNTSGVGSSATTVGGGATDVPAKSNANSLTGDPKKLASSTNSDAVIISPAVTGGGIGIRGGSGKLPQGTGIVSEPQTTKSTPAPTFGSGTGTPSTAVGAVPITTSSTSAPGFVATAERANFYGNHQPNKVANNQISDSTTVTGTRTSSGNSNESSAIKPTSSGATSASVVIKPGKMDFQQNGVGGVIDTETSGTASASGDTNSIVPTLIPPAKTNASASAESTGSYNYGGIISDNESHPQPKSRSTGAAGGKLFEGFGGEIGEDVRLVVTMLANSGLLGPIPRESYSSRPGTARGESSSRPGTARGESSSRPGTARSRPSPGMTGKDTVATARANTAENSEINIIGMRDDHLNLNLKSPLLANVKNGHEERNGGGGGTGRVGARTASPSTRPTGSGNRPSTANRTSVGASPTSTNKDKTPKSDITGSGKVSIEPNFTRSGRTSTPRAASAKANATTIQTPTFTSTLRENSKSPRTPSRNKTGSTTQDLNARPQSALCTTPRSRPSSTLYQHTASSAQKGIQSPSANLILSASTSKATPSPGTSTPKSSSRPSTARPRTSTAKMGDSTAGAAGDTKPATLSDQFAAFSRFGDTSSDGKHITLTASDKWMKQAKVVDAKKITTTDTSIYFKKLFKTTKKVPLADYQKFIEELAKSKKMEPQDLLDKLTNCGPPGLSTNVKSAGHVGVVERLTDTSKYTGSHKERFDSSGKGKGLSGRVDVADSSGYVASFKEKLDLNKDSPIKGGSPSPTPATKESSPAPAK